MGRGTEGLDDEGLGGRLHVRGGKGGGFDSEDRGK